MNPAFKMVAVWCWYRGAGFRGYQQQEGHRTVQGELLRAFKAAGLSRNPNVAGRTDRGVSARMQVLSGRIEKEVTGEALVERVRAHLPFDMGFHLAREVPPTFHAGFSATLKEYRYELSERDAGDVALLHETAALIPGTRDFRVFHFKTSETMPRTVTGVEVCPEPGRVTLRFRGEGFARHMVRMLVGGMTAVARGDASLDAFRAGLFAQTQFHCPTAPAEPLTLWSVEYPRDVDPFTSHERATFRWPTAT